MIARRGGAAAGRRRACGRLVALGVAALAGQAGLLRPASAAPPAWPSRPIRFVVAYSPGGVADTLTRAVAERLEPALGQPVAVENRPGASGNIAADAVARAAPDGHTLLVGATSLTILPVTQPGQAVDPLRALAPVTRLVTQPILIVVHPGLGVATLAEFVALARAKPGKVSCASAGVGTTDHLSAALLASRAGVSFVHVPYASSAAELRDLRAGDVDAAFITLGAVAPLLAAGHAKALAVTGRVRAAALPDVPTVAESGFPGFEVTSWYGVLAPAGTPAPVLARLAAEIDGILRSPELRERAAALGAVPAPLPPQAFADEIAAQLRHWPPIVRAAGIAVP